MIVILPITKDTTPTKIPADTQLKLYNTNESFDIYDVKKNLLKIGNKIPITTPNSIEDIKYLKIIPLDFIVKNTNPFN